MHHALFRVSDVYARAMWYKRTELLNAASLYWVSTMGRGLVGELHGVFFIIMFYKSYRLKCIVSPQSLLTERYWSLKFKTSAISP